MWEIIDPNGDNIVQLRSVYNGQMMDSQEFDGQTVEFDDPVGARADDGTASQRWIMKKNFDGTVRFTNVFSDYTLTWAGTGFDPAYVQRPNGNVQQDFNMKIL